MNIYNNILCGALLLSAAALTGCSDDESYDITGDKNNLVYVDATRSNVTEHTLYRTPVGVYGSTTTTVPVRIQYAVSDGDITVSGSADTTLVSKFNQEHGTRYLSMPDNVIKAVAITPTQIEKGANAAAAGLTVDIPEDVRASLMGSDYVLPIRLDADGRSGDRPIAASRDMGYAYMVVHMSSDIANFSGNTTASTSIVNTPVGTFGSISGTFGVSLNSQLGTDLKVSAEIDNSLVGTFNSKNGTAYEALPSSVAGALTIEPSTIAAGETSGTVKVDGDKELAKNLTGTGYVIPLRLTMTYSNGTVVKGDNAVAYLVLSIKETLINDNPGELLGTVQDDASAWTCIAAENFDKDSFTANTAWKPSAPNISSGSFTIDLGATHKVSSLRDLHSGDNPVSSYKVSLSEDGKKWTDIGDVNSCGKYNVEEGWYQIPWIVLYGGVPARYVKYEIEFDPNFWGWGYFDSGWADDYVGVNVQLAFDD